MERYTKRVDKEKEKEIKEFLKWANDFYGWVGKRITPLKFDKYIAKIENDYCFSVSDTERFVGKLIEKDEVYTYANYELIVDFVQKA